MPHGGRGPRLSEDRARRAARRNTTSDLTARVIVAIPAIGLAIGLVWAGGLIFALGLAVLAILCLGELYTMFERARPARLAGFLAVIALMLAAHYGDPPQFHVMIVLVAAVPVVWLLALAGPGRDAITASMSLTLFGVLWIGVALAHGVMLRDLPHGDAIIIDVLVGTFVGDTGAYLGGRAFGQRRLAPALSPNKTVEGLLIGMLTCVVAVWFAGLYQDWLKGWEALILGAAVAVAAPLGDLLESTVKRDAGTKDTGRLFGAHGGALDRLDAVLFTAVVGYYVWNGLL
jgi:phosphatidate cytidylyltransferase